MKIRINSDGTPGGTKIETEDGQAIDGVTEARLKITNEEGVRATLEFEGAPFAILAQAEFTAPLIRDLEAENARLRKRISEIARNAPEGA